MKFRLPDDEQPVIVRAPVLEPMKEEEPWEHVAMPVVTPMKEKTPRTYSDLGDLSDKERNTIARLEKVLFVHTARGMEEIITRLIHAARLRENGLASKRRVDLPLSSPVKTTNEETK